MGESPWAGHCRRVAALSAELGRRLRLSGPELEALEQAARQHHCELEARSGQAQAGAGVGPGALGGPARAILSGFRQRRLPGEGRPTGVLRVAEAFAERVEFLPFQPASLEQILDEMGWLAQQGLYDPVVVAALGNLVSIRMEDLLGTVNRLPVFPAVALRALQIAGDEDSSPAQMERLVASDQVLAGRVIETANSSLLSPVRRIGTIRQAVAYIGVEGVRRVIMAHVFRPLFGSAPLRQLWKHAIEVAVKTERLAGLSGQASAQEAFLAGLVHDIGRLALERLTGAEAQTYARLREPGTDAVFVELLVCGFDHGAGGAGILRSWSFPAHLVEGVEYHHRPEACDSVMASLVHVAERVSGAAGDEDLPSGKRLQRALKRLGIRVESIEPDAEADHWLLCSLLEAA